jgi:hypothetical protein
VPSLRRRLDVDQLENGNVKSLDTNDLLGSVEISVEEARTTNFDPAIACAVVCCCVAATVCAIGCVVTQAN